MQFFEVLAVLVLLAHLLWILWVIFGWLLTPHRPILTGLHIASLAWGVAVEVGPWPLTYLEQSLEARAGASRYHGGFLVHYLDALIYPDVPETLLTWIGAGVCLAILAIYCHRAWHALRARRIAAISNLPPSAEHAPQKHKLS